MYQPTLEDEQFMNKVSAGYIGLGRPEVVHSVDKGKELWVVEDGKLFKKYVPEEELSEYSLANVDDDASSPSEAWA